MSAGPTPLVAALITGAGVVAVVAPLAWLYLSRAPPGSWTPRLGPRVDRAVVAVVGVAGVVLVAGAHWDASMHVATGEVPAGADFLWPPHLVIYGGFALVLLAAVVAALATVEPWRRGPDVRVRVRASPHLGALALAAGYALAAAPGDALWHAIYGVDLTAWSPPHVALMIAVVTSLVAAAGLHLRGRASGWRRDLPVAVLLGLALNVALIIGTIEWEIVGGRPPEVAMRPPWAYPVVAGLLAAIAFLLARRLTARRGAATLTALAFLGVRAAVTVALDLAESPAPLYPPLVLLGAALMDLAPRSWTGAGRALGEAALFTTGYVAVALPLLALRADLAPLAAADALAVVGVVGVGTALLALALDGPAARLARRSPAAA